MTENEICLECIMNVLKTINKHFENDMGALDLVNFSDDILTLSFQGACKYCRNNNNYLKYAIKEIFKEVLSEKVDDIKYI